MSIEQKVNYQLNKYPKVKKVIKRVYQVGMYSISKKIKSEGDITRVSPNDDQHEYFFGYYDKSPWDITDRYMLCLKANDTWSDVSPREKADILIIDTEKKENDSSRVKKIAETSAWNVQQACMLQWLGPDFSSRILYNDFRDGKYVSVILTLATMEEKVISAPVYSVSQDGKFALTLDFSRLYELRPGYGYYNVPEPTKGIALPDTTAIWYVNLETGEVTECLKYTDFAKFKPRPEMKEEGSVHKVNHIMISPNGKRFMVLYRWFCGQRKYTRLITCNVDGTDMYVLSDDDMVSHCYWKDDNTILAFENKKKTGPGYYLMTDKTENYTHCWPQFTNDGHPSYSPDKSLIVTDSYPDRARIASINIMDGNEKKQENTTIARVFAPFKYDNDTRCDLHPRWNHKGTKICFDSVFEGHRGVYTIDINEYNKTRLIETIENHDTENPKYSIITPMYNSFSLMNRYFDSLNNQTFKDFEIIIVDDCSTDSSYEKAFEYAKKSDLNIRVLKTEKNFGPGNARNLGISVAKGDYILFLDSDDYLSDVCIEKLNDVENYDILLFDYNRIKKSRIIPCQTLRKHFSDLISREEVILWATTNVCGKVYKRSILLQEKIVFPNLIRYEDFVFFVKSVTVSNTIKYLDEELYNYVDNSSSIVHAYSDKGLECAKDAFSILKNDFKTYPVEIIEALYIREILYVCVKEQLTNYNEETLNKTLKEIEEQYPNWKNNKYVKHFKIIQKLILNIVRFKLFQLLKLTNNILK